MEPTPHLDVVADGCEVDNLSDGYVRIREEVEPMCTISAEEGRGEPAVDEVGVRTTIRIAGQSSVIE
ncbi:hypothetical protein DC31_01785 [Microbacterium sp. CH12i]|nr:hypothetical protein DC31_01785 [Microbacterium sp. CH12i]